MTEERFHQVEEVIQAMETCVVEKGEDFRYVSRTISSMYSQGVGCFYVPIKNYEGKVLDPSDPRRSTGCLIGETLKKLGITEDEILSAISLYQASCESFGQPAAANLLLNLKSHTFSDEAVTIMAVAQRRQDRGDTWGEALKSAKDRYFELEGKKLT